ncbi:MULTISPECIES: hypothetical protein [unclassified Rhizobium]|uniref:hypothetical protein n=1 Tax=unclassified Rhizobium TaxID=2613769 RepID=UPI0012E3B23A|nr:MULTISPECIES: hypothetical protein [unclassified Rhizobium]
MFFFSYRNQCRPRSLGRGCNFFLFESAIGRQTAMPPRRKRAIARRTGSTGTSFRRVPHPAKMPATTASQSKYGNSTLNGISVSSNMTKDTLPLLD